MTETDPLDDVIRAALTGPQAHFAVSRGRVVRYQPDVAPFAALPEAPTAADWADLRALSGPGTHVALRALQPGLLDTLPEGWTVPFDGAGVQMTATDLLKGEPDDEAVVLGAADVPEILELVARTHPGPFLPLTYRMGLYLGIRRGGALVSMAGQRMHAPGHVEISAVCTDPAYRGQGLAGRLVRAVALDVRDRGEIPILHAMASNTSAISLYRTLGFKVDRHVWFSGVMAP